MSHVNGSHAAGMQNRGITAMTVAGTATSARLEAQPLYAKVRDIMVERLISGHWKPGQMLPSEFAIADELGVSQGTVRKALDDMTTEGLVVRRQGRGTFVAEAEDKSILFRFYRLTADNADENKTPTFPESRYLSRTKTGANEREQAMFALAQDDQVWRFERLRLENEEPILWERLVLSSKAFPSFDESTRLPNNVYQFYGAECGLIVARVKEKLRAVAASSEVAGHLDLEPGTPVLEINRQAIALDGRTIEWRTSLCRSDTMHYRNELR